MILKFPGPQALSDFRLKKLLAELVAVDALISGLAARYVHFVETDRPLSEKELDALGRILAYGSVLSGETGSSADVFLVVPRLGTISPWSSKATDIARRCGLDAVMRVERGIEYRIRAPHDPTAKRHEAVKPLLYDRMVQTLLDPGQEALLFQHEKPRPQGYIPFTTEGKWALIRANRELGLALSDEELDYLAESYVGLRRNPTDVELMMFAQANSEHCRHKIFNAAWIVDGELQDRSLFGMIRNTSLKSPSGVLSAYKDNAAVVEGPVALAFLRDPDSLEYGYVEEAVHLLMKVETHNHPTAISPHPGAATGSGGEIRDEAATGRGAHTKAGLTGFSVSHLRIPDFPRPWETAHPGKPARIASALRIMIDGPLGGAAFNNEFGRPNLCGYFRTFEQPLPNGGYAGYHKPIMIAGGMGNVRACNLAKQALPDGAPIVVLGGPAMLIGLGGGAASSVASGASTEDLDFASVQRENPEMQRRCQEVINRCVAMGENNPILSVHDVGAGGLSNAVPEIIQDSRRGGIFELRDIPSAESGLSPLQIWCNEAQERYVLALKPDSVERFRQFCERERCPCAVIGHATEDRRLVLKDGLLGAHPVNIPMSLLFGKPPRIQREVKSFVPELQTLNWNQVDLREAARRVLGFPTVADKRFLITIGDRSVGGLTARDQMVGPWQTPVADVAVTATGFRTYTGEAMAMGERGPLALINAPASGRMAVGEALTNIAAARIGEIGKIKLSANWMAAAGIAEEDFRLFETVRAVGMELCPALGIAIPVGKDSLSMRTVWQKNEREASMTSPLSLIVTAFAPVEEIRATLTPQLRLDAGPTRLVLVDLGQKNNRLGGSVLAQVYGQMGDSCPDLNSPLLFKAYFHTIQSLNADRRLLAYHDRSDGGLFATLCEMAFASRCGLDIDLALLRDSSLARMFAEQPDNTAGEPMLGWLFSEELGAVIQVREADLAQVLGRLAKAGLATCSHVIGAPRNDRQIMFRYGRRLLLSESRGVLQRRWSEPSYRMQALRDHPECAQQEFQLLLDESDPGLYSKPGFDPRHDIAAPLYKRGRPRVAILREQGVNGHIEMAAAFERAGFTPVDVHMSDLLEGRAQLSNFVGLAACGGFSYGDVLGAGGGWAKSILLNPYLRDEFRAFFERIESFGLGVCNGCQMMSHMAELIPGAFHWPRFVRNRSEQFEARVVMVEVVKSPSILLSGMEGSRLPVVVAHGEGRAEFGQNVSRTLEAGVVALRYVDGTGKPTEYYPNNPNGSPHGITGLTTENGRFTIMMPHPERCFRTVQNSWHPADWGEDGPWLRMFRNARLWVG